MEHRAPPHLDIQCFTRNLMKIDHIKVPLSVVNSASYKAASTHSKQLLLELAIQLKEKPNGELVLTWNHLKQTGRWNSPVTAFKGRKELTRLGLIIETNNGGPHCAQKFALPEAWLQK